MSWEGFNRLDLSTVEAEKGRTTLPPGDYICKTRNAEVRKTATGGWALAIELHEVTGKGTVTDFINLSNKNADAERIGKQRLKALLECGGHRNPSNPGDVTSMNGLTVGVHVEQGEDFVKDGKTYKGGGKPRRSGAYFKPGGVVETDAGDAPFSAAKTEELNDDIPW
jgi:hypothetical protein